MLKVTLIWIIHIVHHVHSLFSGNNPKRTGLCNQSSFYAETLNVNTALKSVSLVTSLSERSTIVTSPIMPKGVERSAVKHSGIMTQQAYYERSKLCMQHELPAAADNLNTWFQTSGNTRKHDDNNYISTVQETCTYLQLRLKVDFAAFKRRHQESNRAG